MSEEPEIDRGTRRKSGRAEVPPARTKRRPGYLLWSIELLGGAIAATLLAVALLMLRLEWGPIEVNWLTPELVAYLTARAAPLGIGIDRTVLNWTAGRSTVDLVATDIRLNDPTGNKIITIPKLSLSVSLPALLRGRFAATRVAVIGPSLHLVRAESGDLGVDLGAGGASTSAQSTLEKAPPLWMAMLTAFTNKPVAGDPIGYLRQISIVSAEFTVDDRALGVSWRLANGEFDVTRLSDGLEADLSATFGLGSTLTPAYGHFRYESSSRKLVFSTSCVGLEPALLAQALPTAFAPLKGVALPLSVGFGGTFDLASGKPGPVDLRIEAGAGEVVDPHLASGRLAVASARLAAEFDPSEGRFTVEDFRADLGGPRVTFTGAMRNLPTDLLQGGIVGNDLSVTGALALQNLSIERLNQLWPVGLSDGTHEWIAANMSVGAIDELHVQAALAVTTDADDPVRLQSLTGGMSVRNATVQYLPGLPRVEGIDARVTFAPDRLDFTLTSGHLKGINVSGGTIAIDQFGAAFERMTIDLALQGPARDVMTVLDAKRLQYAKVMGIDPSTVAGAVDGDLHFQFPLKNALTFAEINYGAKATLTDLAVGRVAFGHDLSGGAMTMVLDPLHLTLQGNGRVGGVPADLSLKQRISGTQGPRTEVHAKATLNDAQRQLFEADPLPGRVHGPVGAELVYTELDNGRGRAVLGLDLAAATLDIGELEWQKPAGLPAHADLTINLFDGKIARIEGLTARAPGLDLRGALDFDNGTLVLADFTRVKIGNTDATVRVTHRGAPWSVAIHGPVIDLTEPLNQLDKQHGEPAAAPATDPGPTVELDLEADRVTLGPDRALRAVNLTGEIADHALAAGYVKALIGQSGRFSFTLDRVSEGGRFSLVTDDYGALMNIAGITGSVVGGGFSVTGESRAVPGGRRFAGIAEGYDYRFIGAPFMVRLLSVASFDAMATLLRGEGIPFTTLKGEFALQNGQLTLHRARAYGGAIGVNVEGSIDLDASTVSLEGTLVPAYTLNSVLGNVPIIGDILLGGDGQGVFAANFRMGGPLDDPKITVNPLSTLAPGLLRRLFLFDAPAPSTDPPSR